MSTACSSVPIDLAGLIALRGSLVADLRRNLTAPLSVSLRGRSGCSTTWRRRWSSLDG